MSYNTVFRCANDGELQNRVTASCAQEGAADPVAAMADMMYTIASASDVEAAYASAVAGGNEHPGGDESVITDAMILAKVQAALP